MNKLTPRDRIVFTTLSNLANGTSKLAHAKTVTLQKFILTNTKLEISLRQLQRILNKLQTTEYITCVKTLKKTRYYEVNKEKKVFISRADVEKYVSDPKKYNFEKRKRTKKPAASNVKKCRELNHEMSRTLDENVAKPIELSRPFNRVDLIIDGDISSSKIREIKTKKDLFDLYGRELVEKKEIELMARPDFYKIKCYMAYLIKSCQLAYLKQQTQAKAEEVQKPTISKSQNTQMDQNAKLITEFLNTHTGLNCKVNPDNFSVEIGHDTLYLYEDTKYIQRALEGLKTDRRVTKRLSPVNFFKTPLNQQICQNVRVM